MHGNPLLISELFKALRDVYGFQKAMLALALIVLAAGVYDNRSKLSSMDTSIFGDDDDPNIPGTQEELHEMKNEDIPRLEDKTDQTQEEVRETDAKVERVETKVDELNNKFDMFLSSRKKEADVERKTADFGPSPSQDDD